MPFIINSTPPDYNAVTDGRLGISVLNLPFNASYRYSTKGAISGINNHFTIDFDAQQFKQDQLNRVEEYKQKGKQAVEDLQNKLQDLEKKLDYMQLANSGQISSKGIDIPKFENPLEGINLPQLPQMPTLNTPEFEIPSIDNPKDSLSASVGYLKQSIETLKQTIALYKNFDVDNLQKPSVNLPTGVGDFNLPNNGNLPNVPNLPNKPDINSYKSKIPKPTFKDRLTNFFTGVNKFGIGIVHPYYSEFLVARTPIRGINMEYEKNNYYFAFTHGKTVNNLFQTNNVLQNNLNLAQNAFNFFDFNNIQDGRRVTALKGGLGKKNGSHIYVGALYGVGKVSYLDSSVFVNNERNVVLELDAQYQYKKHKISTVTGKSAIQVIEEEVTDETRLVNQLMSISNRTNAIKSNYTYNGSKTDLSFTFRLIDPFFRSLGVGFIRNDNIRYEVKGKRKLSKKLEINGMYRRESDNLLGIYGMQNIISSYGIGATYRPTKRWLFKADVRPLVINTSTDSEELADTSFNNTNYIINVVGTYNKRIKETYITATGLYSHYQLLLGETKALYQNINTSININHEDNWVFDVIYNSYLSTDTSTAPVNNLFQLTTTKKNKKFELGVTGKLSIAPNVPVNFGYGVNATYLFTKNLSASLSAEKLVLGDFYNNLFTQGLEQFPYYGRMVVTWRF